MIGREWREASDMRSSLVSLGLVLLSAALLRYWNLRYGPIAPVERDVIDPVLALIRTGSFRPPALAQPTLPIYAQAAVAIAHFVWGATLGAWHTLERFGPAQVVVWGRGFSALIGTISVVVVYQIGMRWGARHALLGAGLMAVTPAQVSASREVGAGALLTLFAALTLLLTLAATERARRKAFAAAGAAAGLAAACHYAGALTIVLPLVGAWMTRSDDSSRLSRALAAVAAAGAAFLVATPLSVLDLPAFLNGVAEAARPGGLSGAGVDLLRQLLWTLQWPGLILALAGLGLGVVRTATGPGHTRWTLLVSFPLVVFALAVWHGSAADAVVALLLPPSVLLAAIAVISGVSQLRRFSIPRAARTALIAALTVAAVLPPAIVSIELVRQAGYEPPAGLSAP